MNKNSNILITTIPAWSQTTGYDSYATLFREFDPKHLGNLYLRSDLPDSTACSRYFNIREWLVVKSIFNRSITTGMEIISTKKVSEDNIRGKEHSNDVYFAKHRWRIFLWIREILWYIGKWKSHELDEFLEEFHPDVLVFSIESYMYYNRINDYLIKKCKPKKVFGYLWDDNFTYKQSPHNLLARIERFFLRKQVKRIISQCTEILSISPKMKEECDAEFGVNSIVLTKPLRPNNIRDYEPHIGKIRLLYTGSLVIGRDEVLLNIAQAIDTINRQYGEHFQLDIYTQTPMSEKYKSSIDGCSNCILHDAIPQSQVFKEQEASDILIFVESLKSGNNIARLSFSTKITDYLSSKRCILAIGQDDNASIDYFRREDAALVCTTNEQIIEMLKKIIYTPNIISEFADKSKLCGERNHSPKKINQLLNEIIYN